MGTATRLHLGSGTAKPVPSTILVGVVVFVVAIWAKECAVLWGCVLPVTVNVMKMHNWELVIRAAFAFCTSPFHKPRPQRACVFGNPITMSFPIKWVMHPTVCAFITTVFSPFFYPRGVNKERLPTVFAIQRYFWHFIHLKRIQSGIVS